MTAPALPLPGSAYGIGSTAMNMKLGINQEWVDARACDGAEVMGRPSPMCGDDEEIGDLSCEAAMVRKGRMVGFHLIEIEVVVGSHVRAPFRVYVRGGDVPS